MKAARSSAGNFSPSRTWEKSYTVCHVHIRIYLELSPAVPVNLKDRDEFHLTIEEYLQSLISLVEELVRHYLAFVLTKSLTYFTDPPRSQCCHSRRLRASAADQPVRQGLACRLPDSQPQERQLAP
jgi:hypothetical protein